MPDTTILTLVPASFRSPQERCAPLREEVRGLLTKAGVSSLRMMPVKRSYGFENREVPHGPQWVLKVGVRVPCFSSTNGGQQGHCAEARGQGVLNEDLPALTRTR